MKQMNIFVRTISLVLALTLILGLCGPVSAFAAESGWVLSGTTEIFWAATGSSDKNNDALEQQVKLFAAELAEKVTGKALPISYGAQEKAGSTDIILVLDKSLGIAAQGYQVSTNGFSVTVSASDADGLFYGCRNLIQQLLTNGYVTSIASAPDVAERALSLDCGRKYYSADWIKNMIKEMSWSNMNALVLHFSEEMGLGIESKTYPWLAGRDGTLCVSAEIATDNKHLTQDEIREIGKVAKLYHVELIPSFDSPGHLNYAVKKYNEHYGTDIGNYFHYNGKTSIVQGSRNTKYSRGIDISNDEAVTFIHNLITEYGNLFRELGCTKFDIGGDELLGWGTAITTSVSKWKQLDHWKQYAINRSGNSNAVAYDGFMYYMNDLYDLVTSLGYTSVRMWNDDALRSADTGWNQVVTLNKNIEILYWTSTANSSKNNVWTYLNAGYKVHNYLNTYNYYVLGIDSSTYPKNNQKDIYQSWSAYTFDPNDNTSIYNVAVGNSNVKGSAFCIWCDNPTAKTQETVLAETLPMLRASGAKAWDADMQKTVSYTTFTSTLNKIGGVPSGNLTAVGDVYIIPDVTALQAAVNGYDGFDASPYTDETAAAYAAAVEEGRQLLASSKPTQSQADAATQAIAAAKAALALKPTADTSALVAAIAEYETVDCTPYTTESFSVYRTAVNSGKALLEGGTYTQDEIDNAVQKIKTAKEELFTTDMISAVDCFINGGFKNKTVNVGKIATLNMNVYKGLDIKEIKVYSDLGTEPVITRSMINTRNSDRDVYGLMFSPTAADRGQRTYTVYAVMGDGQLSADCLTLTLTIR